LVLAASLTHCRIDKLINPAIADHLVVRPDSLRASANAGSRTGRTAMLRITSADAATLPWNASVTTTWLTLAQSSGGAPDSVTVTMLADTLSQVLHHDTIFFTSVQAPGDTVRVPVTFEILPPAPELSVAPLSHLDSAFAGSALPRSFAVRMDNTGALPLTWSGAVDTGWLGLSKNNGGAPPLDSTLVALTPAALATGTYTGTLTITAPGAIGSPATVSVSFKIKPCAEPFVVPDTVVTGFIALSDCGAPQRAGSQAKLYSVTANAGDTLSFRLTSPDFDAYLALTDSLGSALGQNDDCPLLNGPACLVNFRAPVTGRYVIEATTAAPGGTGAFSLSVVRERTPGVPQEIGQFRGDSVTTIGPGQVIAEDVAVFRGRVTDPNPGDSVRLEVELTGVLSGLKTDSSAFVPVTAGGVVVAIRTTGLSDNEGYRWRVRTCDRTGRCSAWVGYGDPNPDVDFYVNHIPQVPAPPGSLNQFDGETPIPPGGGTGGAVLTNETVTFRGVVMDPDPGDVISLEVEVRRTNQGFTGTGIASVPVSSGATASVTMDFPVELLGVSYHWRGRACDQTNRCSAWVSFGGSDGSADFTVP
jgi:hypothetical protein